MRRTLPFVSVLANAILCLVIVAVGSVSEPACAQTPPEPMIGCDLAFDPSTGQLFALFEEVDAPTTPQQLLVIDPSTEAFCLVPGNANGASPLYTLDIETGILTEVGLLGVPDGMTGLTIRQSEIFLDGFESGGTGQWSSVVGEPPPDLLVFLDQPFPDTYAGMCSPPEDLVLQNTGSGTLNIDTLSLLGRFFFQPGQGRVEGPISIPPFGFAETLDVYFCPDIDNDLTYFGQLAIQSNDPESPHTISLSGNELEYVEIGTAPYEDGDTWSFPNTTLGDCSATHGMSIMNPGSSPLTLANVASSNIDFNIVDPLLPNTVLDAGQSIYLELEFCPVGSIPGTRSGILTIHHDAINEPDPITISLYGNAM